MDEKKISFRYISKNMAGAQKLMKQMKAGHWLMLIVVVVLVIAVYNYSNGKGVMQGTEWRDGVAASLAQVGGAVMGAEQRIVGGGAGVEPSPAAEGQSSDFASAEGAKDLGTRYASFSSSSPKVECTWTYFLKTTTPNGRRVV
jgi:hypothetical protein